MCIFIQTATAVAEEVVSNAEEPPLASVMGKPNDDVVKDKPWRILLVLMCIFIQTATAVAEEVVSNAEEPPLASVMGKPNDDVVKDKPLAPPPHDDAKALIKVPEPAAKKASKGSLDRDIALAKLDSDKKLSIINAWEENEKSKVENKAQKKLSDIAAWENSKKAALESELKKFEEKIEKKKGECAEKIKNKVAEVHRQAEVKRAFNHEKHGEDVIKVQEMAAKFRATGQVPSRGFACFGG